MTELELAVEQFDASSLQAMREAQSAARSLGHGFIGTEHLLLGAADADSRINTALARYVDFPRTYAQRLTYLLQQHPDWARHVPRKEALAAVGVSLDEVQDRTEAEFGTNTRVDQDHGPAFTPRAADALRAAASVASAEGRQASAADIAVAALSDVQGYAALTIRDLGAEPTAICSAISTID